MFPVQRLHFHYSVPDTLRLPEYAGSTLRGAFGHALRRSVCVTRQGTCDNCLLLYNCAYPYLFETRPEQQSAALQKAERVPHPFIIEPPLHQREQMQSSQLKVGMVLLGQGIHYAPQVIHAMHRMGEIGLGKQRTPVTLEAVTDGDSGELIYSQGSPIHMPNTAQNARTIPPPPSGSFTIELRTPLRLKQNGKLITTSEFSENHFTQALARRIKLLAQLHGKKTPTPLLQNAYSHAITFNACHLQWWDWTRYPSRQQTTMQLGGLHGELQVTAINESLWPLLYLGQWAHIGKNATFGLGHYVLHH